MQCSTNPSASRQKCSAAPPVGWYVFTPAATIRPVLKTHWQPGVGTPPEVRRGLLTAAVLWSIACVGGLLARPLLPLDETRYTAVAWEMFRDGQWLVPHLNGVPYHHKPPLLFWLMGAGWSVLGVHEHWARLVAPLLGLAALPLTARIGLRLWPDRPSVAALAPVLLAGTALFALFSSLIFFDLPLTMAVLLAWLGVLRAADGQAISGWGLAGLGIGLGILFKGPVALLHAGLPVVLAPIWLPAGPRSWARWYGGGLLALVTGGAIALAWAIPAARAGGPEFSRMLFFGQHAGRVVGSFQHAKPIWWYLVMLPVILFPWTLWGGTWEAARGVRQLVREPGVRFIASVGVAALVIFSLISGKQPQYLLPLFPMVALLLARGLDAVPFQDARPARGILGGLAIAAGFGMLIARPAAAGLDGRGITSMSLANALGDWNPAWGLPVAILGVLFLADRPRLLHFRVATVAGLSVCLLGLGQAAFFGAQHDRYDQGPTAQRVAAAQAAGRAVGVLGGYEGQFTFGGRLNRAVDALTETGAQAWAERHPDGLIVAIHRRRPDPALPVQPEFIFPHRGRLCYGWRASDLVALGDAYLRDVPRQAVEDR
ncbi:MAG: glycosyltransferase family 39 protein [Verrucomicrobiae bacterium]|nr:glycosyltransferase family 39 protein [Verrucomicrobiae bacterium]